MEKLETHRRYLVREDWTIVSLVSEEYLFYDESNIMLSNYYTFAHTFLCIPSLAGSNKTAATIDVKALNTINHL